MIAVRELYEKELDHYLIPMDCSRHLVHMIFLVFLFVVIN